MSDDAPPPDHPKLPRPVSAPPSPNPLKRKEPSPLSTSAPLAAEAAALPEEYNHGHILCQVCGLHVNIRDRDTGGFTVQMWEEHRERCFPASAGAGGPRSSVIYTPESTAQALAHPPAKRRRAKRTEEERIDYLRADAYVAQFEAYRVLCASCDKWIRLRPNSTYCSIPWDAHRKSCLAKKINNKNAYALEERNSLFSKDPDIRKFDAERLLCNRCDQWLSVPADEHLQAVQKWLHHRASCNKTSPSSPPRKDIPRAPPLSETQLALASSSSTTAVARSPASSPASTSSPRPRPPPPPHHVRTSAPLADPPSSSRQPPHPPPASPSFHDLNPINFAPIHESRRRNAEQRAATLRADTLIGEVEPNRVFCSLCSKWVQLRQDSSFCAYPWLQHRGKCLARHQRRAQKAAEIKDFKTGGRQQDGAASEEDEEEEEDDDDDAEGEGVVEQEDPSLHSDESDDPTPLAGAGGPRRKRDNHGAGSGSSNSRMLGPRGGEYPLPLPPLSHHHPNSRMATVKSRAHHHHPHYPYASPYSLDHRQAALGPARRPDPWRNARDLHHHHLTHASRPSTSSSANASYPSSVRRAQHHQQQRLWDDMDAEGDVDADAESYIEDEPSHMVVYSHQRRGQQQQQQQRRPYPAGLADLDSANGRKQFVASSIEFLFSTTYEATDDMPISSLLPYLNAAMPLDKHEDFDTAEVVRYVAALKDKGRIVLQGDTIRVSA